MMEDIGKTLERIGLTSNEAKIYLSILKNGSSKVGKISKISQMNRTTTYDVLNRLLDKGLIGYKIKGKVKYFEVSNPNQLKDFIEEKRFEVIRLLPELEKLYKSPEEKYNVTLYYGYRGVKSVFQDFLRNTKIHYLMDSEGKFAERMPYFAKHFVRQLEKRKIKIRHLVRHGRDVHKSKTTEVRYIKKKTASDAVIDIYNDKVAIIIWSEPPEAVLIQNKAIADSLREYFDILWKSSSKI